MNISTRRPPDRLQKIIDGLVINLHPFGRDLSAFCSAPEQRKLLPGHDFMDGGCLVLALALSTYLLRVKHRLVFVGRSTVPDHVAIEIAETKLHPCLYLDGDGLALRNDILEKMRLCECVCHPIIRNFDTYEARLGGLNSFGYITLDRTLAQSLTANLGVCSDIRLSLFHYSDEVLADS